MTEMMDAPRPDDRWIGKRTARTSSSRVRRLRAPDQQPVPSASEHVAALWWVSSATP